MLCPCQSNLNFTDCCLPLIVGEKPAQTPEQLMRSRYSAYATQHCDYLYQTQSPDTRADNLKLEIERFAGAVTFIELKVLASSQIDPTHGQVEFVAKYIDHNDLVCMQENSNFIKLDELWYYTNGDVSVSKQKINRNQTCVCGSGLKFKRCCGA